MSDDTTTNTTDEDTNATAPNGRRNKSKKWHWAPWIVLGYLVLMQWWNTQKTNKTLETIVDSTKLDTNVLKDVDYKLDYTPFGPIQDLLGGFDLTTYLVIALLVAVGFLLRSNLKNKRRDS